MSTYAVGISAPTLASRSAPAAKRGLLARFFDRMVEARMRQAEIEVRRQLTLLGPQYIERAHFLMNDESRPYGK